MKKFESETNDYIVKILKYIDKKSIGDKGDRAEKKKLLKETMIEEY